MLRVGVLCPVDLGARADGIAAYLRSFFKYARGLEMTYWGGHHSGRRNFGENEVVCYALRQPRGTARILPKRMMQMWDLWRRRTQIQEKADVLFVHSSDFVISVAVGAHAVPIVIVMHGWNPPVIAQTRGWLRYAWLRLFDRLAVRYASKVILVSNEGYRGFCDRYGTSPDKFVHIPTFLDDDLLAAPSKDQARRLLSLGSGLVILCVARLVPEKQVDQAIKVLAEVRRHIPDAVLLIVGEGPQAPNLKTLSISLGLEHAIRFEGAVPHAQISAYFAAADFFLLLSRWEGTSIALLEALTLGIPSIVTDIADHGSLVLDGVNGAVVSSDSAVEEAVEWILRMCADKQKATNSGSAIVRQYLASDVVPAIVRELQLTATQEGIA